MAGGYLDVVGNGLLDSSWVGTDDLGDFLTVLEQDQSWHSGDFVLLGDFWQLVDIFGAIILHGPHQVAKKSTTTNLSTAIALSNSETLVICLTIFY